MCVSNSVSSVISSDCRTSEIHVTVQTNFVMVPHSRIVVRPKTSFLVLYLQHKHHCLQDNRIQYRFRLPLHMIGELIRVVYSKQ